MSGCKCEQWTLSELSTALESKTAGNKKIVIPMFQRGKRWNAEQEKTFIDSVKEGYPVGTMLFFEKVENNQQVYVLVDGLQRSNTIKKYIHNPIEYLESNDFSDALCVDLLSTYKLELTDNMRILKDILMDFISTKTTFKNLQFYSPSKTFVEKFNLGDVDLDPIIEKIQKIFEERQNLYDTISGSQIPVIVYSGDEKNLPVIFERINSKGTALTQYEIYAASWPIEERKKINNKEIINYNIVKYDDFTNDDYQIYGFDPNQLLKDQQLNAFDYLFGLSKHLVNTYSILEFNSKLGPDEINPLGFELVNACLNDSDKISELYKNLRTIDINLFEADLYQAIKVVEAAIKPVTTFKGNKRNSDRVLHSKFQIMSMISTTFKKMFGNDLTQVDSNWKNLEAEWSKHLLHYYVYDIITNFWSDGGTKKIYQVALNDRYMVDISSTAWNSALDGFYNNSMQRIESATKKIDAPKNEEYVILNCIYLNTFTAMQHLGLDKFDVEHIATKNQMKDLITKTSGIGLPISSIANLCYLPEKANRVKQDNNFYQDKKYLQTCGIELDEIESKYSFTKSDDLAWMNMNFSNPSDFVILKEAYFKYCDDRFEEMKKRFCDSLGIDFAKVDHTTQLITSNDSDKTTDKYTEKTLAKISKFIANSDSTFVHTKRKAWITTDGQYGVALYTSKIYTQGQKKKFWYSFKDSDFENLQNAQNVYAVFSSKDDDTCIAIPKDELISKKDNLNFSTNDEGEPDYWHIVLFRNPDDSVSWLLSKPEINEINIDKWLVK